MNTSFVIAGARGLFKSMNKTMLAEYGEPATLSKGWDKPVLKRMNFTRRVLQDVLAQHRQKWVGGKHGKLNTRKRKRDRKRTRKRT